MTAASEPWLVEFGRGRVLDMGDMPPAFMAGHLLLSFCEGDSYVIDTPLQRLVVATFWRSTKTYRGVLGLLLDEAPAQAAMLARSLFEDVVVAHWLVLNEDDPDWLVERFEEHRDAMALHQYRLARETGWSIGTPFTTAPAALLPQQNELVSKYGGEAQRNWWDPGQDGRGHGKPIGLRDVCGLLEDAAAARRRFHPRFAGGQEALLRRMELVALKWFSQTLHHTALGLPMDIGRPDGLPQEIGDPSDLVAFVTWWSFAQQVYLLHDLYGRPTDDFDERMRFGLSTFAGTPAEDNESSPVAVRWHTD